MQTKVKHDGQLKEPTWYVKHNGSWRQADEYAKYEGVWYPSTEPPPPDTSGILGWLNGAGVYIEKSQTDDNIVWTAQVKNMSDASKTFTIENSRGGYSISCDFSNITGSDDNFDNISATCNGSSGTIEIKNRNKIIGDFGSFSIEAWIGTVINNYYSNKFYEVWNEKNDGTKKYNYGFTSITVRLSGIDSNIDGDISVGYLTDYPDIDFYGYLLKQKGNRCESYNILKSTGTSSIKGISTKSNNAWLSTWIDWPSRKRVNFYFSTNRNREIWFSNGDLYLTQGGKTWSLDIQISGDTILKAIATSTEGETLNFTGSYPMGSDSFTLKYTEDQRKSFKLKLDRIDGILPKLYSNWWPGIDVLRIEVK